MNEYNKSKGRWVDERIEQVKQLQIIEPEEIKAGETQAPQSQPPYELWVFELESADAVPVGQPRYFDFIGRMYDIHNHQSRVDQMKEDGETPKTEVPGIPLEVPYEEGIALKDFFKTQKEWQKIFVELKNKHNL